jgi:ribosomal protein L11 methyltransferase
MGKGEMLVSGFYEEDLPVIIQAAELNSFTFDHNITKNRWVAVRFIK